MRAIKIFLSFIIISLPSLSTAYAVDDELLLQECVTFVGYEEDVVDSGGEAVRYREENSKLNQSGVDHSYGSSNKFVNIFKKARRNKISEIIKKNDNHTKTVYMDNFTLTLEDNFSEYTQEDANFRSGAVAGEAFIMPDTTASVPLFYKELSNTILSKFDVLSALTPDDYRYMITPTDSSSPYSRYSNFYYGDESNGSINIGLKASNFLLDTIFEELTGNILTLNFAQINRNSSDVDAMKIQAQPLSWLKLKFIVDLKSPNPARANLLELEFNPTSNTALILRNKDNSTETQTGIEFRVNF